MRGMWPQTCAYIQGCNSCNAYGQNEIYEMPEVRPDLLAEKGFAQGQVRDIRKTVCDENHRPFFEPPQEKAGLEFELADDEGLELFDQIVAMIGVNFQGDRLGQIQAEDTQDGLTIYNVTANTQVQIIGVLVGDIDKILDILCKAELDIYSFHNCIPLLNLCALPRNLL